MKERVSTSEDVLASSRGFAWTTLLPLIAIAGVVLVATFGLLMPIPKGGRILPALGDMVHAPMFAGLTLSIFGLVQLVFPSNRLRLTMVRLALVAFAVFMFGGVSELAQRSYGRTPSIDDLVADCCGIVAAVFIVIAWITWRTESMSRSMSALACFLAVSSVLYSWIGPIATINDIAAMRREFPTLSSFERDAELQRWHFAKCRGQRVQHSVTDGRWSLQVQYQASENPTVTMYEMNSDWTKAEKLVLDACLVSDTPSPASSVKLAVQIIDKHHDLEFHDVCRREFTIRQGEPTQLTFPRSQWTTTTGRPLDLTGILFLDLQLVQPATETAVCFDAIRLDLGGI